MALEAKTRSINSFSGIIKQVFHVKFYLPSLGSHRLVFQYPSTAGLSSLNRSRTGLNLDHFASTLILTLLVLEKIVYDNFLVLNLILIHFLEQNLRSFPCDFSKNIKTTRKTAISFKFNIFFKFCQMNFITQSLNTFSISRYLNHN
jgi:hypothetical protein